MAKLWTLILFVGMATSQCECSQCVETDIYHIKLLPPEEIEEVFSCYIDLPNTYPTWRINNVVYDSTNLPPGFFAVGSNFSFLHGVQNARVQCFFQIFYEKSVAEICSDIKILSASRKKRSHAPYYCHLDHVIYSIGDETSEIYFSIDDYPKDTDVSFAFASCTDPGKQVEYQETVLVSETSKTFQVNSLGMCSGKNITVTKTIKEDNCKQDFSLPAVQPTERNFVNGTGNLVDDLSNDHCNFNMKASINYEICVHTQTMNKCYIDTCNESIQLSWCKCPKNQNVSLVVDGAENGTIISVFCRVPQEGKYIKMMLFNFELVTICEDCQSNEYECKEKEDVDAGNQPLLSSPLFIYACMAILLYIIIV